MKYLLLTLTLLISSQAMADIDINNARHSLSQLRGFCVQEHGPSQLLVSVCILEQLAAVKSMGKWLTIKNPAAGAEKLIHGMLTTAARKHAVIINGQPWLDLAATEKTWKATMVSYLNR